MFFDQFVHCLARLAVKRYWGEADPLDLFIQQQLLPLVNAVDEAAGDSSVLAVLSNRTWQEEEQLLETPQFQDMFSAVMPAMRKV